MRAKRLKYIHIIISIATVTLLGIFSSSGLSAQDFSSGYKAETSLPTGMIVSLESQEERLVVPANKNNVGDLLGVVIGGSNSLLNLSTAESNVQVVTSGVVDVLVTDSEGVISEGDSIAVSDINGIGQKGSEEDAKILGTAQADFSDSSFKTVTTESGESRRIAVARIPVLVQVGGNPDLLQQTSYLPGFVQETANALAGEPVAPARIVIALVIITGGIAGSMILLYGAVSSTIISIGRNPLSDKSIYAGLVRMVLIAVGVILLSCVIALMVIRS